METILEIIIETILLLLFIYPGAFIRWLLTACRRPFKEIANEDGYLNGTIGITAVGIIVVVIKSLFF